MEVIYPWWLAVVLQPRTGENIQLRLVPLEQLTF